VGTLGYAWFNRPLFDPAVTSLIVHELGHERCSDHLSDKFSDACTDIGGEVVKLAIYHPERFQATAVFESTSALILAEA
jgi:hypothetical protein